MISIFLDFSKAYDTVKHEIIKKKTYDIRGLLHEWLKSNLTDRSQYGEIQKHKVMY